MYVEHLVLDGGRLLEMRCSRQQQYVLRLRQGRKVLLEYCGSGTAHLRRVRGRETPYEFKSVEQLRYDFERDAEGA